MDIINAKRKTIGLVLRHLAAERRPIGNYRQSYPVGIALMGRQRTSLNDRSD
jgi:hypothetical protein